jgi:6-phosphogluconolactonase (cycloisomerase 2 family)
VYNKFVARKQDISNLDVFRADPNTGKLTYTGNSVECSSPSSMLIAQ